MDKMVGSVRIRLAAVVLVLACFSGAVAYRSDTVAASSTPVLVLTIASGTLALMAVIFSFGPIYALWMRFAESLHKVVVSVLFGACYLVFVPAFYLISWPSDPLRLRDRSEAGSFWVSKRSKPVELNDLQRMG